MKDREKTHGIQPPRGGDFPDWDNPEDADWEDAPEGYYDEDEDDLDDDDGGYTPGPDDPDYDLSEAAGYAGWEEPGRREILPQWLIAVVSILLILAVAVPAILVLR
jgi:hypothetical protein